MPPGSVPEVVTIPFSSFRGIDLSDSALDADPSGAREGTVDVETTSDDRLRRAPGLSLIENMGARRMAWAFVQAHLDVSTAEIVFIDPPYVGVKQDGATVWTSVGLSGTSPFEWVAANYGNILLFSNAAGNGYARQPGSSSIESLTSMPAGRAIEVMFGRVFVGSPNNGPGGSLNGLNVAWNASSFLYNDWTGLGAGNESLITQLTEADHIVAIKPLGFDLGAILLRQNIWVMHPTGDANRPADFRSRIPGVGCVSERTAKPSPYGVIFLSDTGVRIFDGNAAPIISSQINPALLPLDYGNLHLYSAAYCANRYYLATPTETWVYDFAVPEAQRPPRWYRRSAVLDNVLTYTPPSGSPTVELPPTPYFMQAGQLGKENQASFANFTTPLMPKWTTVLVDRKMPSADYVTHGLELEYKGQGIIKVLVPNAAGELSSVLMQYSLPAAYRHTLRRVMTRPSRGRNIGMELRIVSGDPILGRITQLASVGGEGVRP